MHIEADRALIPAHTPTVCYLTVAITAPPRKGPAGDRAPVAVSLVLDRSGSMDGRKIEMAREAVAHAIRLLDERDQLALVVYDDEIDTLLEVTPASKETKKDAMGRLAQIDARGSTDLAGGWFRGVEQIERVTGDVRRVLLLTDGLANRGIVDHGELVAASARFREQGITTSTFGVGADFDEELLSTIATHGGGHFYFIEKAKQIPDLLASELGETLEVVAREAMFDITCGPGVEAMLLNDLPSQSSDGRVRVRLGDLVADQEITLTFALTCAARPPEAIAFVDCRVTDRDAALFQQPMRVEWRAADSTANARQPVNQAVLVAVAEAMAQRAKALALAANRQGDFAEARRIIRDIAEHLRALARDNPQIGAIVARLLHEEEQLGVPMSAMARKKRHFDAYVASHSRDVGGQARRKREPASR